MLRCSALMTAALLAGVLAAGDNSAFARARANGQQFDQTVRSMQRLMKAWIGQADPKTLLLPERLPGGSLGLKPGDRTRRYTPHNSAADLYPYLILTAEFTDPDLYHGVLSDMLRNEIRYTTVLDSIPANYDLNTGTLGPPSLFGAGEYAKDGLIAVTELLGRTPWFYRMVDMTADVMKHAPVATRFGNLPDTDSELNGDVLQTLVRLIPMTADRRFLEWAERIGDAYVQEVLPGSFGVPPTHWDFAKHTGDNSLRLRDHGNEMVVGLTLLLALEQEAGSDRVPAYTKAVGRMLDQILKSANDDGMLYNEVNADDLRPKDKGLADTWGYVYGSVYSYYMVTGQTRYRDAVRRVLRKLPKYRNYDWESGSFDGYADSIESAIYLANREPVPEAFDWIESEMKVMAAMQKPSGFIEHWYGEGNYNRTALLYALYKSQGCRPDHWVPGLAVGAVRDGDKLLLTVDDSAVERGWRGRIRFDFARHRRVMNYRRNYIRLNEFPEWYTVDENRLYRVSGARQEIRLGSELIEGIGLESGNWTIEPVSGPPYGHGAQTPERESSSVSSGGDRPLSFTHDLAPILAARCAGCHRPGEIGPMPLTSYSEVRPWAKAIKAVVLRRTMPPWGADPEVGLHFRNDRSLTAEEIRTVVDWVDSGGVEGAPAGQIADARRDADAEVRPPDLVIRIPGFRVPASGTLEYTFLVTRLNLEQDKWVEAAEWRIENPSVVHHINAFVRPAGSSYVSAAPAGKLYVASREERLARREDEAENDRRELLIGYEPGYRPEPWGRDTAKLVRKGSDLIFEMHYTANGKPVVDHSELRIYFAKTVPLRRLLSLQPSDVKLAIPPGDPNYRSSASVRFTAPVDLVSLQPHMHLRGKAYEIAAKFPDGRTQTLLRVPRYDFRWQTTYYLQTPLQLPAGTVIECTGWFDNSPNNPTNPDPTKTVYWGNQSWDEMNVGFLEVAFDAGRAADVATMSDNSTLRLSPSKP